MLKKRAIISRFNPYTLINNAPILPIAKRVRRPKNGEKIIGKSTGRLVTSLTVVKGWKVRPRSVLVQIYAVNIKNVFFFIYCKS